MPAVVGVEGLEGILCGKDFLAQWQSVSSTGSPVTSCVVSSSERTRDALAQQLQMIGIRTVSISAQSSHTDEVGVVYLSTMHRAKGLEFDCVAVVAPKAMWTPWLRRDATAVALCGVDASKAWSSTRFDLIHNACLVIPQASGA